MQTRRVLGTALGAIAVAGAASAQTSTGPEATFDRVRRTGVVRIAALPGEQPFFRKDLATGEWSGVAIDMAKSIANAVNAKLEYIESTYGNSVLDLQANKIDLAFALNPTPQRALAIGFTRAYYRHPFGFVARKGFTARTWDDLNKPPAGLGLDGRHAEAQAWPWGAALCPICQAATADAVASASRTPRTTHHRARPTRRVA